MINFRASVYMNFEGVYPVENIADDITQTGLPLLGDHVLQVPSNLGSHLAVIGMAKSPKYFGDWAEYYSLVKM